MGIGYHHGETLTSLEFQCAGLPLAISHWEAIRGYMEYEVNDLKSIQDLQDLQGPDDRPTKACTPSATPAHACTSRSATVRAVEHRVLLVPVPRHDLVDDSQPPRRMGSAPPRRNRQTSPARRHARMVGAAAAEQWAKPSEELLRLSEQVRQLQKRQPRRPVTEIFAEVQRSPSNGKRRA
jgi:hypothetical protein